MGRVDAPNQGAVTHTHDARSGQHQRQHPPGLHTAFSVQPRNLGRRHRVDKGHDDFNLSGGSVGCRVDAADLAHKLGLWKAVDPKRHALPQLEFMHAVGRHQAFKAHALRVDDLDQLLAHLGRVTRRNLALADHTVKRRADLGAAQLLPRAGHPGLGRHQIALGVVAPHLGVFQCLHRRHALRLQRLQALQLTFGLLRGLG